MSVVRSMFLFLVLFVLSLSAQVPRTVNYQGKLTNTGGVAISGPVGITFNIYDAETGGTMLWSEAHASVTVTNGLFDVILGESSAMDMDFDEQY